MSTVRMSKVRLVGLKEDKSKVLDVLYLSSCAHIKSVGKIGGTQVENCDEEIQSLESELEKTTKAIESVEKLCEEQPKEVSCDFNEFVKIEEKIPQKQVLVGEILSIVDQISQNYNQILKCKNEIMEMIPVEVRKLARYNIELPTKVKSKDDDKVKKTLDIIYAGMTDVYNPELVTEYEKLGLQINAKGELFFLFRLKKADYDALDSELQNMKEMLQISTNQQTTVSEITFSFTRAMPDKAKEIDEKILSILEQIKSLEKYNTENFASLKKYDSKLQELKVYSDYIQFKIEKLRVEPMLANTENTFVLECYVAKKELPAFMEKMQKQFSSLLVEEESITAEDIPPTKLKNNKVVESGECVVDMYASPSYNEVDPTSTLFFFFTFFFGLIISDVCYGIILAVGGFLLSKSMKSDGSKKLTKLIGAGGIASIIWGLLFGHYFGFSGEQISFLPAGVMPDPQKDAIVVLLISLLLGVCQLICGYVIRGINLIKKKKICQGIVNGFSWALFMLGVIMWASGMLMKFFNIKISDGLQTFFDAINTPGLIVMLSALAIGVIFAGIGTKGFTKITKSFSALYGVVNLFSDVLSYARLFGLMLSGSVIAEQFNNIAVGLMGSVGGYIIAFFVLLIGHVFNIAMSILSAYIHNLRLQYVEFFGKFYEGNGVKFKPFGAELKYTKFTKLGGKQE